MITLKLCRIYLLSQLRNRQILLATVFFSVFLIFLFNLAFQSVKENQAGYFSGIFWISSFFVGNLILTNQTQLQSGKFQQGLLLTGTDSSKLFFSKLISSLLYMLLIQGILWISMNVFFEMPEHFSWLRIAAYCVMGSIGFLSIGTLFFSLIEFQNIKDLLITILFYPLVIPLFLYLHKATSMILSGKSSNVLDFVIGYDLIFVFLSALLYEFIIEDNV